MLTVSPARHYDPARSMPEPEPAARAPILCKAGREIWKQKNRARGRRKTLFPKKPTASSDAPRLLFQEAIADYPKALGGIAGGAESARHGDKAPARA